MSSDPGDPPGRAGLIGEGPAPHRPTTAGEADRAVAGLGLPAGGRGAGDPELRRSSGGQGALEVTAVRRHPLGTAAHVETLLQLLELLLDKWKLLTLRFCPLGGVFISPPALPSAPQRNVEPSQPLGERGYKHLSQLRQGINLLLAG